MRARVTHLQVAKVLHEDDKFITLEIAKHDDQTLHLDPDGTDRFFTLIFVRSDGDGGATPWVPWEPEDETD